MDSIAVSKQESPGFDFRDGMGLLWVLEFPPTVQKHVNDENWIDKIAHCV